MNQLLFGGNGQSPGHLKGDVQSLGGFQRSLMLYTRLDGLAVYELHDVKILVLFRAQVEDRRDVRMAQCRGCARFAQKSLPRGVTLEVGRIDDFEGNRKAKVRIVS